MKGLVEGKRESFGPEQHFEMIKHILEIAEETDFSPEGVAYALFNRDDKLREGTLH